MFRYESDPLYLAQLHHYLAAAGHLPLLPAAGHMAAASGHLHSSSFGLDDPRLGLQDPDRHRVKVRSTFLKYIFLLGRR